ncbi:MAG: DUF3179 domain-containing protein [Acidobacteria bacterium]|nr:DUF3179 domain-containing protein [Acidobacteriota bacterium]
MYARTVGARELTFGVSGMLWRDNLVMYDRQTDSWWAQALGDAIEGPLKGQRLTIVESSLVSWKEWRTLHPATLVLDKQGATGMTGTTDRYETYHGSANIGVTGRTRMSGTHPPKMVVVGFQVKGRAVAVPMDDLQTGATLTTTVEGLPVTVTPTGDRTNATVEVDGQKVSAFASYWFAWRAFYPDSQVIRRAKE